MSTLVTSFIIDFKETKDGLKILEFGRSNRSGFAGYKGGGKLRETIAEDIGAEFGLPVVNTALSIPDIQPATDSHSGIFYPPALTANLFFYQEARPDILFVDLNQVMLTFDYKSVLATTMKDAGLNCIPRQATFLKQWNDDLPERIRKELGDQEYYVLKLEYSSLGKGIVIVKNEDLEKTLHDLLKAPPDRKNKTAAAEWADNSAPIFIVQTLEKGKEVPVQGKAFDPTIRAIVTVTKKPGQEMKFKFYPMYYKLPVAAVTDGTIQERTVSKIDPKNPNKVQSASLDYDTEKAHTAELTQLLTVFINSITQKTIEEHIASLLSSPVPEEVGMGLMLADRRYFHSLQNEIRVPKAVEVKIMELCKTGEGPVIRYLHEMNRHLCTGFLNNNMRERLFGDLPLPPLREDKKPTVDTGDEMTYETYCRVMHNRPARNR